MVDASPRLFQVAVGLFTTNRKWASQLNFGHHNQYA